MTFNIRSIYLGNPTVGQYEIVLGEYKEIAPLITTLWSFESYEAQWIDALRELSDNSAGSCVLITDIQPPEVSVGITYWAMYREGRNVYLQEQLATDKRDLLTQRAISAAPHIPLRVQGTLLDQSKVSEWKLSIEDIYKFIEKY